MAKAKMKKVVIPKFSTEAQEAAWWDSASFGNRGRNPAADQT